MYRIQIFIHFQLFNCMNQQSNNRSEEESLYYEENNNTQIMEINHTSESRFGDSHKKNNHHTLKLKSLQKQINSYVFPIKLLQHTKIQNKEEFKHLLSIEANQLKISHRGWVCAQRRLVNKELRMYVRCQFCEAKIIYKIDQEDNYCWYLKTFNNTHIHDQERKFKSTYKLFNDLDVFEKNATKLSQPMNRTYLLKKKKQILKNSNFNIIKSLLRHLKYDIRFQHLPGDTKKQGYPKTLVGASVQQKMNYKKYGECVCYDFTDKYIKEISFSGEKFGVGIFSGFDNNNRMVIFGISITTFQDPKDFQNVFNWFFDIMKNSHTTCIITQKKKILITALQRIRRQMGYKFHHAYDHHNFIQSFKRRLKNKKVPHPTPIVKTLRSMMKQSDQNVGMSYLKVLKQLMQKQELQQLFQNLQSKLQRICLWKMPNQFLGLSLASNQSLTNLLKLKENSEISLYELIQKFDKCSREKADKSQKGVQYQKYIFSSLFRDQQLQEVRNTFEKVAFNAFIYNYNRAQLYRVINSDKKQNKYSIQHMVDQGIYIVLNWGCSCGATIKTGIPCEHIIFIKKSQQKDKSYIDLFNERWFPNFKNEIPEQEFGKTRSRTMKF